MTASSYYDYSDKKKKAANTMVSIKKIDEES